MIEWWIDPDYDGDQDDTDENLIASGYIKAIPKVVYDKLQQRNAELEKQFEIMNKNCISYGLHEIRIEALEKELAMLRQENERLTVQLKDHQPFDAYYKEWEVERGVVWEELVSLRSMVKSTELGIEEDKAILDNNVTII